MVREDGRAAPAPDARDDARDRERPRPVARDQLRNQRARHGRRPRGRSSADVHIGRASLAGPVAQRSDFLYTARRLLRRRLRRPDGRRPGGQFYEFPSPLKRKAKFLTFAPGLDYLSHSVDFVSISDRLFGAFSITLFRCNPLTRVLRVSPRHEFDAGSLSFVIE